MRALVDPLVHTKHACYHQWIWQQRFGIERRSGFD